MNETIVYDPPRDLNTLERGILVALLSRDFPGRQELLRQTQSVRISEEHTSAGKILILTVDEAASDRADVETRVPVEAQGRDTDGMSILILLHVLNGYLAEIELIRGDGGTIQVMPNPADLVVTTNSRNN